MRLRIVLPVAAVVIAVVAYAVMKGSGDNEQAENIELRSGTSLESQPTAPVDRDEPSIGSPFDGTSGENTTPELVYQSGRDLDATHATVPPQQQPAGASGAQFVAPASGASGMDLVVPDVGTTGMEYVAPEPGSPGMEYIAPEPGNTGLDYIAPDPGSAGIEAITPEPGGTGLDYIPPEPGNTGMDYIAPEPDSRGMEVITPDPEPDGGAN